MHPKHHTLERISILTLVIDDLIDDTVLTDELVILARSIHDDIRLLESYCVQGYSKSLSVDTVAELFNLDVSRVEFILTKDLSKERTGNGVPITEESELALVMVELGTLIVDMINYVKVNDPVSAYIAQAVRSTVISYKLNVDHFVYRTVTTTNLKRVVELTSQNTAYIRRCFDAYASRNNLPNLPR